MKRYSVAAIALAAVASWKDWLAKSGPTAKLKLPLRLWQKDSYLRGHILIAGGYKNIVEELDAGGTVVWTYGQAGSPWSAEKLANGNTLIAASDGVYEVDPSGKAVWEFKRSVAESAQRLPNGNTLIAVWNSGEVIEVTPDKKIVWEIKELGACDAFRLPNGNTLINGDSRCIEATPEKKVIWERKGANYGTIRK